MNSALWAAIAGVLGVILGRFWDWRSEAKRWRRDQRVASYQRLNEAFILAYEAIRRVALAELGSSRFMELVDDARRDKNWDNALAGVWFHGSQAVAAAALAMDEVVTETFYKAQEDNFTVNEWNQLRVQSGKAYEAFVAAIRRELRLAPIPVTLFSYVPDADGLRQ